MKYDWHTANCSYLHCTFWYVLTSLTPTKTNTANKIMSISISPKIMSISISVLLGHPAPSPFDPPCHRDGELLFVGFFPICRSCLGKCLFKSFAPFSLGVFLLYSHVPFNDGNTSWEMRRHAILSLCKQHSVQLYKPRWCSLYTPSAPTLQACTACYCTRQHQVNSSRRENDAVKRRGEHQMYAAAACITQLSVLQQTPFFFLRRKSVH